MQHYAVGRLRDGQWRSFRFPDHALEMFPDMLLKPHMQYLLSDIAPYCLQTLHHTCHVNQIPSLITHFSRDNTAPSSARFVQDWEVSSERSRNQGGAQSRLFLCFPHDPLRKSVSPSGLLVNAIWMDSTTLAIEYLVCLSVRRYLFLLDSFNEVLSYLSTMLYIAAWTVRSPSVSSAKDPAS